MIPAYPCRTRAASWSLRFLLIVVPVVGCGDDSRSSGDAGETGVRDAQVMLDGSFPDTAPDTAEELDAMILDAGPPDVTPQDVPPAVAFGECRPYRDGVGQVSHQDCAPVPGRPICDTSVSDRSGIVHLCVAEPVDICDACSEQTQCDTAQPGSVCAFLPPIFNGEGEPIAGESGCLWPCDMGCEWLEERWSTETRVTCREGFCVPDRGAMTCQSTTGPGRIP